MTPNHVMAYFVYWYDKGVGAILRCHLTNIGNPIVEIRRSYNGISYTDKMTSL